MSRFRTLFPGPRPIIGMIALPPMPGYPAFTSIDAIVDAALADLERLEAGGVDGALVENDFDQPHTMVGGAEIHAAMTRVTREVVARARIPIGVEVLLNDWRASLAIAAMTGARFIRIDFFVDRVMTKLGPFEPEPEAILAYRQAIKAEQVQLFTDLQVKYTTPIGGPKLLAGNGRDQVHLLVVMTSERGLCGGFNSTIVRLARARANELLAAGKTVKILTVGKKGREQLRRDLGQLFVGHVDLSEVKRMGYDTAHGIAKDVLSRFDAGEFDVATIFFNRFQSVISQIPTAQQIIPAVFEGDAASALYDYEPTEEAILADLLPRGVATQIFTALLENAASEQGARMSAMDNATRNAGDMINKLTIQYNRSRQAAITKELIEIISGAEAL